MTPSKKADAMSDWMPSDAMLEAVAEAIHRYWDRNDDGIPWGLLNDRIQDRVRGEARVAIKALLSGTSCAVCGGSGWVQHYATDNRWTPGSDPSTWPPGPAGRPTKQCVSCGGTGRCEYELVRADPGRIL